MSGSNHTGALRVVAWLFHIVVWISSIIVMGIISSFLNTFNYRGVHIVYTEVISVITLCFWIPALVVPLLPGYKGYYLPLNLIFSYLWITAFIFSVEDWNSDKCNFGFPGVGRCGRKHTVQAFNFIAFIFLFFNVIIEAILLRASYQPKQTPIVEKHHSPSATASNASTSAAV